MSKKTVTDLEAFFQAVIIRSEDSSHQAGYRWSEQREVINNAAQEGLALVRELAVQPLEPEKIVTPCPHCGRQTLFIGSGGHLTCSFLHCKNPSPEDQVDKLWSELKELRLRLIVLKSFLQASGVYDSWRSFTVQVGLPTEFEPRA